MKWIQLLFVCAFSAFLTGISGCDSRMKVVLLQYELAECPQESFALPTNVVHQKWGLKLKEPRWVCSGTNYYLMADEKARAGGGFGKIETDEFYAKVIRKKSCSLVLAFAYDSVAEPTSKERIVSYANDAANALFQGPIKAQTSKVSFETIGKPEDFKKWCEDKAK